MNREEVRRLIGEAVSKAGSARKLAKQLAVSHTTVNDWIATDEEFASVGKTPRTIGLFDFCSVLGYLGGDISRALPTYSPPPPNRPATVTVWGRVDAGSASVSESDRHELDAADLNWNKSPAWQWTTGPVVYLRVSGRCMAPNYPEGCLIACRAPHGRSRVPDGWPVVFQDASRPDAWTFKRFYTIAGRKRVVTMGVPINPLHKPVVFADGAEVRYLVLGKVEPQDWWEQEPATPEPDPPIPARARRFMLNDPTPGTH